MEHTVSIRDFYESRGLTQEKIAEQLEISQVTVSKYARGVQNIPLERLKALAELLDVSMGDLVEAWLEARETGARAKSITVRLQIAA